MNYKTYYYVILSDHIKNRKVLVGRIFVAKSYFWKKFLLYFILSHFSRYKLSCLFQIEVYITDFSLCCSDYSEDIELLVGIFLAQGP